MAGPSGTCTPGTPEKGGPVINQASEDADKDNEGTVPLDLSLSGKKDKSSREEKPSGKEVRREQEPKGERGGGRSRIGDSGASTRVSQQPGSAVASQDTHKANGGTREATPLDLSRGSKEREPIGEVRRKGEHPRKHPQEVMALSRERIEEEGGKKADVDSEDEEGHHPQRAGSNRSGQPGWGGEPQDRRKQIHRKEELRQERPYACKKCKYRAHTPWNLREHQERYRTSKELICDICKKAFKWRREAREHMKTEHNLERFFCVIAGCGVSRRTAADIQHNYKVAKIHKRAYQGNQRVATGGKDHPPPREAHIRDRGTKRPKSGREKSPNVKQQETNRGGKGYDITGEWLNGRIHAARIESRKTSKRSSAKP